MNYTVKDVSRMSGVSARTLRYYDSIGLLKPAQVSEAGYRLYDDESLARLQNILLYRELCFPLKEIGRILDSPDYDRRRAMRQQLRLLLLQKERLEKLIDLLHGMEIGRVKSLVDFKAFDTRKIDEYAAQAQKTWGQTAEFREFQKKTAGRTKEQTMEVNQQMMGIFQRIGALRQKEPSDASVQALIEELRSFITKHFYQCRPEILKNLGDMYAGGGEMTENIDAYGGEGTAAFCRKAIEWYCAHLPQ